MTWPTLPAFGPRLGAAVQTPAMRDGGLVTFPVLPSSGALPEILLSASQVDTFLSCARKWAFKSLWKIDAPPDSSAVLGTAVHSIAEDYLTHGTQPDVHRELPLRKGGGQPGENVHYPGAIFQAGIHLLPPPGTVYVEGRKKWRTPAAAWQGQMDGLTVRERTEAYPLGPPVPGSTYRYPYDRARPLDNPILPLLDGERLTVLDHKSTSDFKYQKLATATKHNVALQDDVQANLYAWAALDEFKTASEVDLLWIYYRTRGRPEARKTHLTVTRSHVTAKVAEIDQTATSMLELYKLRPQVSELPPTTSTCSKYGGCPYRDRCPLTFAQRFTMSADQPLAPSPDFTALVAQLKAQQAAGGLPPPGALPAAAPVQPALPAAAPVQPAAPATWQPGAPLNTTQQWLVTQPTATWFVLAMAADPGTAPDQALANQWDQVLLPPHQTGGQPIPRQAAQPAPAQTPTPSIGGMNPPDAPPFQVAQPSEMPQRIVAPFQQPAPVQPAAAPGALTAASFDGLDRDALKQLCVSKGLCTQGCRIRDRDKFVRALVTGQAMQEAGESASPPAREPLFAPLSEGLGAELAASRANGQAPQTAGQAALATAAMAQPGGPTVDFGTPAQLAQPAAPVSSAPAYAGGYTLLVHCMPVSNPAALGIQRLIRMADIWREVQPQVEQIVKAPHYAMVDFGKGRGLFAGLVQEWLVRNNVGPGTAIQVDPTPEGTDALTTLERFAGPIIRGGK